MKLQILPASTGFTWVKLGVQTFFKQPLALGGLFFMFIAAVSMLSILPLIGTALALMIVPAATLGLMVASLEAHRGKFPMPSVLATAFRSGQGRLRAMLTLGTMYAVGYLLIVGLTHLIDDGASTRLFTKDGEIDRAVFDNSAVQTAMILRMLLLVALSTLFWHSPALVHWYGIAPSKAIFFSLVACVRNTGAYIAYGLGWFALIGACGILITLTFALLGLKGIGAAMMVPLALMVSAMITTSAYFTFRDSFVHPEESPPQLHPPTA
ncbi:MAG: BPSS1780 family membrane protein [Brachymonas sp.]